MADQTSVEQKSWYVYALCYPDTHEIFYIGKGTGDRMHHHERLWVNDENKGKRAVIEYILAQGKEVFKQKIAVFYDEKDALLFEWALINLYASRLTNRIKKGSFPSCEQVLLPEKSREETKIEEVKPRKFSLSPSPLLSLEDAAEHLNMHPKQVCDLISKRKLVGFKVGSQWRFMIEDIENYLNKSEHGMKYRTSSTSPTN